MNERIKELEKQSYITFKDENSFECLVFSKEKFAELIVQECANACYEHEDVESFGIYPIRVEMVTKACANNIRKHFEVE